MDLESDIWNVQEGFHDALAGNFERRKVKHKEVLA